MTPREISQLLANQAERVARELLPDGKKQSQEWRCGSVDGDKGQSLGVCLSGDKVGTWKDFASGEGGDLIDLFAAVNHVDLPEAIRMAKRYLGIRDDDDRIKPAGTPKTFKKPERSKSMRKPTDAREYLKSRGLTDKTIDVFKIAQDGRDIVFPYLRNDELIFIKWLGIDRPDGKKKIRASGDSEPCLFGWQTIPKNARSVTITEGEIDAMSAWQCGYPALSVPFGGGAGSKQRWIEYEFDNLERFDQIYLALDNDAVGKEATKEIINRLGRERCSIVSLPSKDWNETLQAMIPEEDIARCYKQAEAVAPAKLASVDNYRGPMHSLVDNPMETAGMSMPWSKTDQQIRFRGSEVSIWTGWNGHGKSLLLGYLAIYSVLKQGEKWVIASMEMNPAHTLNRMAKQAASSQFISHEFVDEFCDAIGDKLWLYDQRGTADLDDMLSAFKYAAKRYGVKNFVIDSLAKLGYAEDDYTGQKNAINQVTAFAQKLDVHVHFVAHPKKGSDENQVPNKMDVRGGASLTDMADNVLTVWRNKAKQKECQELEKNPDMETKHQNEGDVRLIVSKQRGGNGWEGTIALWFDDKCWQYLGAETHRAMPLLDRTRVRAA